MVDIDKGYRRIIGDLKRIDRSYVDIGVLSDAGSYETKGGKMFLPQVAALNEFGSLKIPSRPFMRQTFDRENRKMSNLIAQLSNKIYEGKIGVSKALKLLGEHYKSKIQEMFETGEFLPNAPLTIKKKKSTKPLIDTGRLRQSISYRVG